MLYVIWGTVFKERKQDNELPLVGFKNSREAVVAAVELEWKRLVGNEIGAVARRKFTQSFIGHASKCIGNF